MKKVNPKNRVESKAAIETNNCACPVMTMTAQFFIAIYLRP